MCLAELGKAPQRSPLHFGVNKSIFTSIVLALGLFHTGHYLQTQDSGGWVQVQASPPNITAGNHLVCGYMQTATVIVSLSLLCTVATIRIYLSFYWQVVACVKEVLNLYWFFKAYVNSNNTNENGLLYRSTSAKN